MFTTVHKLVVFQPEWQFQIITSKKASGIRIGHLPAANNYHSIFFLLSQLSMPILANANEKKTHGRQKIVLNG